MIALFDFIPVYCPNCGYKFSIKGDILNTTDYNLHCSCGCRQCGLQFQYTHTANLLEAAGKDGDLLGYVSGGMK